MRCGHDDHHIITIIITTSRSSRLDHIITVRSYHHDHHHISTMIITSSRSVDIITMIITSSHHHEYIISSRPLSHQHDQITSSRSSSRPSRSSRSVRIITIIGDAHSRILYTSYPLTITIQNCFIPCKTPIRHSPPKKGSPIPLSSQQCRGQIRFLTAEDALKYDVYKAECCQHDKPHIPVEQAHTEQNNPSAHIHSGGQYKAQQIMPSGHIHPNRQHRVQQNKPSGHIHPERLN